ncbi:hypothetical protein [Arthrobacter sp. zg-Y1110]|uniref:hypothetical protein n=1 Tax=Arthrobacter sp. zg-Y1110 TaxID=2886932 RepID=UPI001D14D549|nr:hypothetical protein [Arthrobacter sp. zg-Y1110]MCC3292528.1 hypothetical protein [Arthrobacter sp. zg-Y1110]UWX87040.1 hypothetical protein N2K99_16955 [Arthrobacter sp. zg-Y1110]
MKPSLRHRFLSVPTGTRLELTWAQSTGLPRRIRSIFAGIPKPGPATPEDVDPAAFRKAFEALHEDPDIAAASFRSMGYDVAVSIHDTAGIRAGSS